MCRVGLVLQFVVLAVTAFVSIFFLLRWTNDSLPPHRFGLLPDRQNFFRLKQMLLNITLHRICQSFDFFGPQSELLVSVNGGKESVVVLDLVLHAQHYCETVPLKISAFSFVSSDDFPEMTQFVANEIVGACNCDFRVFSIPDPRDFRYGMSPLMDAFPNAVGIFLGVRSTDRVSTDPVLLMEGMSDGYSGNFTRIHVLFDWGYADVWDYLLHFGVPFPSLYREGYTSIGSMRDTNPNPRLELSGDTGPRYAPAWELREWWHERSGRIRKS